MIVVTLDTGALIAMERRKERGTMLLRAAREHRARLLAITPVVAEWWRGRTDVRERIKASVTLVPFPIGAAEAAGVVLGKIRGTRERVSIAIDVMVMSFAAIYGGALVYTSDVDDLQRIGSTSPKCACLRSERTIAITDMAPRSRGYAHARGTRWMVTEWRAGKRVRIRAFWNVPDVDGRSRRQSQGGSEFGTASSESRSFSRSRDSIRRCQSAAPDYSTAWAPGPRSGSGAG